LRWALEKEKELDRPFILPILIDPVQNLPDLAELLKREYLDCFDQKEATVKAVAEKLESKLVAHCLQRWIGSTKEPVRRICLHLFIGNDLQFPHLNGGKLSQMQRPEFGFLGHSMHRSVDPSYLGGVLKEQLKKGVDVRLIVLDPFDASNQQIKEISRLMKKFRYAEKNPGNTATSVSYGS